MKHEFGIISGLWGDNRLRKNHRGRQGRTDAHDMLVQELQKNDRVDRYYCHGFESADALLKAGIKPVLLNSDPWPMPRLRQELTYGGKGTVMWGCSYWMIKLLTIRHALHHDFESVVWRDLRVQQKKKITHQLVYQMHSGQNFQAKLYWATNWTWAARWRRKLYGRNIRGITKTADEHSHYLLSGALLYFRGTEFIDRACEVYNRFCWYTDEQVLALTLDFMTGGHWIGKDAFYEEGYEIPGYDFDIQIRTPEVAYWQATAQ